MNTPLQYQRTRQNGGTILGIIVGVLVGLGAALAVAVYITKVPIPFVNKNQARGAEQDAAETKKNKDWDPNTPLYGKNPAKPGPAASGAVGTAAVLGPAPTASVAAKTAAKPAEGPSAAKSSKPDTKPAADPLGDLAKAKTAGNVPPATAAAGAGVDPFTYFVQVGAFRTPEDAEGQRAKLSLMGMDAKITEREQSGRTVFRVRVGPFDKKDEADKTKEKLDGSGIDTALVRIQR